MTWSCTVSWRNARYSVPHAYADTRVWVREDGGELVVTGIDEKGPIELCRHTLVDAGDVSVVEGHYPVRRDPLQRPPRATKPGEAAFLRIGTGAAQWLTEAAGTGTRLIEKKMSDAVALCSIYGTITVDHALGVSTTSNRRRKARLPTGKTFDAWDPKISSIPRPNPRRTPNPGMG